MSVSEAEKNSFLTAMNFGKAKSRCENKSSLEATAGAEVHWLWMVSIIASGPERSQNCSRPTCSERRTIAGLRNINVNISNAESNLL